MVTYVQDTELNAENKNMFLIPIIISVLLSEKLIRSTGLDSPCEKIGKTCGKRNAGISRINLIFKTWVNFSKWSAIELSILEEKIVQVGDMLFYGDDFFTNETLKGAITSAQRLWDGGIIPYEIDDLFSKCNKF